MQKRWSTVLATAVAASLMAGTAQATVVFQSGNNPQPNEENILLNSGDLGNVLLGTLNQSGAQFKISNPDELLTSQASGQATVNAQDGSYTFLRVEPAQSGVTFQDIILDIALDGNGQVSGSVTLKAFLAGGGSQTQTFSLGPGNNFFTIVASGGDALTALEISEGGANEMDQIRQIRISGVGTCTDGCQPPPVAEPGMLALLGGSMLGMVGFAGRRRA